MAATARDRPPLLVGFESKSRKRRTSQRQSVARGDRAEFQSIAQTYPSVDSGRLPDLAPLPPNAASQVSKHAPVCHPTDALLPFPALIPQNKPSKAWVLLLVCERGVVTTKPHRAQRRQAARCPTMTARRLSPCSQKGGRVVPDPFSRPATLPDAPTAAGPDAACRPSRPLRRQFPRPGSSR